MEKLRLAILSSLIFVPSCQRDIDVLPPPPRQIWQVYHPSDTPILDDKINQLTVASDGTVWISSDHGASYRKRANWGWVQDSLYGYRVNSIVEAKDRAIWFCLSGGGVIRLNLFSPTAVWRRYAEPDLIYDYVLSGAADRSNRTQYGELWFATAYGLSRFVQSANEQGSWLKYSQTDSGQHIAEFPTNTFLVAANNLADNTFWFGAEQGGTVFVSYGLASLQWSHLDLRFRNPRVLSIGFDLSQRVWIGGDYGGVSVLDFRTYTWTEYNSQTTNGRVPEGRINSIVTDYLSTRWFGTDGGLVGLNDTTWTVFTTTNSPLPSDTVTALALDTRANLWIGTARGLAVYNQSGISF